MAKCSDASIFALAAEYLIELHEVARSSAAFIKDIIRFIFSKLVFVCVVSFVAFCVLLFYHV